jgi:predicted nucleotidyltransferase
LRREPEDILEYEIELESKLEKLDRFRLDVRVLNRAPISFAQNVIRHGRLIIDKEPNIRSDFESYVLKKYFDFARFRRVYLTEVINAPL